MAGELSFTEALRRQRQLNVLTWIVILALIAGLSLMVFALTDTEGPSAVPLLADHTLRVLLVGFLVAVVLYLADQHSRMEKLLKEREAILIRTAKELESSRDALEFAHQTAIIMGSHETGEGLSEVLRVSAERFGAEAAARVGDDVTMVSEDRSSEDAAAPAMIAAAVQAVAGGSPLSTVRDDGSQAVMAVPLRVQGKLRDVLCTWRRQEAFAPDQLEGLILVGRIIELSLENEVLEGGARRELIGTLSMLETLVETRLAVTGSRAPRVTKLALALGNRLGYDEKQLETLRIAAMTHDIGMLEVPDAALSAERGLTPEEQTAIRSHAERGAWLAGLCEFSQEVHDAILAHHERVDGSGYPRGLRGQQIPLDARILAVCDSYHSMTSDRPYRVRLSRTEALSGLRTYAGIWYDKKVVEALVEALGETPSRERPPATETDGALAADGSRVLLPMSAR